MWEIFTHGKEPYTGLNKAQILDKVNLRVLYKAKTTKNDYMSKLFTE